MGKQNHDLGRRKRVLASKREAENAARVTPGSMAKALVSRGLASVRIADPGHEGGAAAMIGLLPESMGEYLAAGRTELLPWRSSMTSGPTPGFQRRGRAHAHRIRQSTHLPPSTTTAHNARSTAYVTVP